MDHKRYLSDPGIFKDKEEYFFNKNKKKVFDKVILERLTKIKAPPAWKNVWYASDPRCHIQVYGTDVSGKKQYILSEKWINNAKSQKFNRMKAFIRQIPAFKKTIKLSKVSKIDKETLIHLLFNLLIDTHIRVGNEIYAEQNKTYGLTTLRQKHLVKKENCYLFVFTGKSKINHSIEIPSEYNYYLDKLTLEDQNKPLFYYEKNKTISSEELNVYLRNHMGKKYTCKDFRTYSANIFFIKSFLKRSKQGGNIKKIILNSIDDSAKLLGHTRSICRKSYISNTLIAYCTDHSDACVLSTSELLSKVWASD